MDVLQRDYLVGVLESIIQSTTNKNLKAKAESLLGMIPKGDFNDLLEELHKLQAEIENLLSEESE